MAQTLAVGVRRGRFGAVRADPCKSRGVLPLRDQLPTRLFPFVNYSLIAANVAGFFLEWSALGSGYSPDGLLKTWGLVPRRFFVDPAAGVETVFTSMFMHDPTNLMHIGGNMLFLWIFGDNVEDAMGHSRYAAFYLSGGVAAAAAQTLVGPHSTVPMVGASGAISAVLAAYLFLYPRSPITVINPIPLLWLFWGLFLHFPAWLVIGEFFLVNLWSALTAGGQGGVAFMAHVGGFVAGAVLLGVFMAGRERVDDYARWQRWANRRSPQRRRDVW
jgi:membrane associated rhomboid family serine protease